MPAREGTARNKWRKVERGEKKTGTSSSIFLYSNISCVYCVTPGSLGFSIVWFIVFLAIVLVYCLLHLLLFAIVGGGE